ncbi:hypothetical protein NRB14_16990 [Pseudomonas viridiflava]|uniref:hypothetical protein n=1 Tax=Pseudomonas viridiflava TaxID=33069 RepID=UPI00211D287D|nr:hypothetical protein [Pseudomonas viridiflava]MCQ9393298.1 hypothetical protein [Pseudomonas viridiflava]
MNDIELAMLDAQDHFLRGANAVNKTFAAIAGRQLRDGQPEVMNQYRQNGQKAEALSREVQEKRDAAEASKGTSKAKAKN